MVNCTCAVDASSARPISGSDGRYMSIDIGPSAVNSDSNNVSASVPGRSIGKEFQKNVVGSYALAQRLYLQLRRELVELRQQRRRDRHAVAEPFGAAFAAAV